MRILIFIRFLFGILNIYSYLWCYLSRNVNCCFFKYILLELICILINYCKYIYVIVGEVVLSLFGGGIYVNKLIVKYVLS